MEINTRATTNKYLKYFVEYAKYDAFVDTYTQICIVVVLVDWKK